MRRLKTSCNPNKWTLGRINSHSINNVLSRFSVINKSNKNLALINIRLGLLRFNYCRPFYVKLPFFDTNWFCSSLVSLVFCKWLLSNKSAHPWHRQTCGVVINSIVPCFEKLISKKQEHKSQLNWNTLANFWKSTFWFYYFVHISSTW